MCTKNNCFHCPIVKSFLLDASQTWAEALVTKALVLTHDYFRAGQYIYRGYLHFCCILNPLIAVDLSVILRFIWKWYFLTLGLRTSNVFKHAYPTATAKKCFHCDLNSLDLSDQQRKVAPNAVRVIFAFSLILVKPENNWHLFLRWSDVLVEELELDMDKRNSSVDTETWIV